MEPTQVLIKSRREKFRVDIRKQDLDKQFKEKRLKLLNSGYENSNEREVHNEKPDNREPIVPSSVMKFIFHLIQEFFSRKHSFLEKRNSFQKTNRVSQRLLYQ